MRILAIETSCDETAVAILEATGPKTAPVFRVLSNIVSSQVKIHTKFGGVVPNLARREHEKNLAPILVQALKEALSCHSRESGNPEPMNTGFPIHPSLKLRRAGRSGMTKEKKRKLHLILEREPELWKHFEKKLLNLQVPDIDAIAVTYGPGLAPALWVGVNFARALSFLWDKPLMPINHMAGHFYSAMIKQDPPESKEVHFKKPKFPLLALLVSGAHSELVLVAGHGKFRIIGQTLDDAAGEAFDKVARMLGFGYPGGPLISKAALDASTSAYKLPHALPRPMLAHKNYNFSFSGLKTSVLYLLRDEIKNHSLETMRPVISREFQNAVVDVLTAKTLRAAHEFGVKTVALGGGVAANSLLRQRLANDLAHKLPKVSFITPEFFMTGDNALMIALAAYFCGKKKAWSQVQADANINIDEGV